jgi:hypothetical protein
MSLPIAQQRILDVMADGLRLSEPKLAAKFAIFTRLCASEAPTHRERLTGDQARASCRSWLQPEPGRWARGRVLLLSQLAVYFVVLFVLVGVSYHGAANCRPAAPSHVVTQARAQCTAPSLPGMVVK